MKKTFFLLIFLILSSTQLFAAGKTGFGIQLGEPTALTAKFFLSSKNSAQFSLGSGSFAGLRITGDYLWHFDVFSNRQFMLYAGPGAVIGLGRGNKILVKQDDEKWFYRDDGLGLAGRGIVGVNYILKSNPIEFYIEAGVLIGVVPAFGALSESAIGVRFYL
jgi:hypothetical protein